MQTARRDTKPYTDSVRNASASSTTPTWTAFSTTNDNKPGDSAEANKRFGTYVNTGFENSGIPAIRGPNTLITDSQDKAQANSSSQYSHNQVYPRRHYAIKHASESGSERFTVRAMRSLVLSFLYTSTTSRRAYCHRYGSLPMTPCYTLQWRIVRKYMMAYNSSQLGA